MAGSRPKLYSIDAFAKTVEDARIRTTSGGLITLFCVFIVLLLIRNEYQDYTLIIVRPELVVDRDINKQLDINLDISYFNLPCDLLSLDFMDESGDGQLDVLHSGFEKIRLIKDGEGNIKEEVVDNQSASLYGKKLADMSKPGPNGECGSCYGALPQDKNQYCCNDCDTVRLAYTEASWAFYDGENIKQCEESGYVARVKSRIDGNEGCRVKGTTKINRISGTMDFAPGSSSNKNGKHFHDLSLYEKHPEKFNFDHVINHLSFGKDPENLIGKQSTHPLDGRESKLNKKHHTVTYYLKVVATRFEFIDLSSPLDTNQFSVITHDRPMRGGKDEDHQHTVHARGGMPGVFFHFDISPLKIINREQYAKTWSGFVLGVISSIAGVLMVGTLIDKSVYAAQEAIKGKKEL